MEVVLESGEVSRDTDIVLDTWQSKFHEVYNPADANCWQVDSHYNICNNIFSYPCNVNDPISIDEVLRSLNMAKHGKAAGIDDIKSEVLQNPTSLTILHRLFNVCFDTGIVPKIWSKGIINPLPKSSTTDPRDPLQYRGITLAPAAYKLYCRVLNERLTTWVIKQCNYTMSKMVSGKQINC